jgi:hypothetical protein
MPAPELVERIFNSSANPWKFRTYRNHCYFLAANQRARIDLLSVREYRAPKYSSKSESAARLSGSQQKHQKKSPEGTKDLAVRVSLTNTYRHLFYPANRMPWSTGK